MTTPGLDIILGADSISAPLTGIGRYALELARGLPEHPAMARVRYFSLGRWVDLPQLLQADTVTSEQAQAPTLRSVLAGNRAAVQAFRLLMPPLQRLRLRNQGSAIYHSPNFFFTPLCGPHRHHGARPLAPRLPTVSPRHAGGLHAAHAARQPAPCQPCDYRI